jgi:predicted nucleotidyltransferase
VAKAIRCGNYLTADGEPFEVTPATLKHWTDTFKMFKDRKIPVPIPSGTHFQIDAEHNRGNLIALSNDGKSLAHRCITRHHYHHYRGFYATQQKLIAKEEPKRAKPVLYAYRVLMTGIRLLRTGELEANLPRLNEHFRLGFLDELIAKKVGGENIAVGGLDWPFHEARLAELEAQLDQAFQESKLPEDRERKPVNELLVRLRLS